MKHIYIGSVENPAFHFTDAADDIKSASLTLAVALVNDELSIDQFIPNIIYYYYDAVLWAPRDFDGVMGSDGKVLAGSETFVKLLPALTYGTPVWFYNEDTLIGKFYIRSAERIGKWEYRIECMSGVGLLDRQTFYGGVYGGALTGDKLGTLIPAIVGETIPYEIDTAVSNTPVYGWLPITSKREALHQALFAANVSLIKNADGSVRFTFLDDDDAKDIPEDRIYMGGSVQYPGAVTAVEVTEHYYGAFESDEETVLYDNTDGTGAADHTLVQFDAAPVHDLRVSDGNLTIEESGVNYAVLSGTGILVGKPYTHITHVLRKEAEDADGEENVLTVTDATMVTLFNAENVAKRLLAYYTARNTTRLDIVLEDEKCGDQVGFVSPYGAESAGYLTSMDITVSGILKAACEIVSGYSAQGFGNYYTRCVVLTGSGTWTVPEDAPETVRVIVIGGGQGGTGGMSGEAGKRGTSGNNYATFGTGGKGGKAGNGGTAGKSYTFDAAVTAGQRIAYSCGVGGTGGASGGIEGGAGTDTVFNGVSSVQGAVSPGGVVNLITGDVYGIQGASGVDGGDGGSNGDSGAGVTAGNASWKGGDGGGFSDAYIEPVTIYYHGGAGSGAAYGRNGRDGGASTAGDGVAPVGGTAIIGYGSGGRGGHGGSGGGGAGWFRDYNPYSGAERYGTTAPGAGGTGGTGGQGGDGCIMIYY